MVASSSTNVCSQDYALRGNTIELTPELSNGELCPSAQRRGPRHEGAVSGPRSVARRLGFSRFEHEVDALERALRNGAAWIRRNGHDRDGQLIGSLEGGAERCLTDVQPLLDRGDGRSSLHPLLFR